MKNSVRSILAFILLVLFCIPAYGSNKEQIYIDEAKHFLSSDGIKNNKGEEMLNDITGKSSNARFLLGWWVLNNKKGEEEKKRAFSLIKSACSEGDLNASYLMMDMYREDKYKFGVKDPEKATKLLKKILLEINEPLADDESMLGKWLLQDNPEKNKEEAIFWLEKAVEHGNTFAVMSLAPLFTDGKEKDLIKAWFYSDLGGTAMASEKRNIESQMTLEQLEQAQQLSWNWQDEHHIHVPGYRGQGSFIHWQVEGH